MTSAREPAATPHCLSLGAQVSEGSLSVAAEGRKDPSSVKLLTAFAVLAASPATVAQAQQAAEPADDLPPLVVETTAKKKKQAAAKKKAAPTSPVPVAPAPEPVAERPQTPPLPGQAGPVAPGEYKADYVTSNKITGPLLDTPQTVTVIPGTVISERGATNLTQALRNTPGISFDAGENGFSTSTNNFKIRGFDTSGSVFVDGVRNSGSFARDMFNIDQVEVVKGAAADNGRGGAAGYVNLVTKTPQLENFVRGEASLAFDEYGTDPLFRSTIDVNQRVGTVAVRMNGMYEDGGVMGRDVAELEAYGLAPSIAFGLGTETRAILSYERLERHDLPDWGVPGVMVKGLHTWRTNASGADRDNFYGLKSDYDDVYGDRVMARIEHDISDNFTITNQTVWDHAERDSRFTVPTGFTKPSTVGTQRQYYDRTNEIWSNQTNLAGTFVAGGFKHTISTGVEFTRETSDANRFGTQNTNTDIFDPNPSRPIGAPLAVSQVNSVEIRTVAGYFYDTIQLTRQLELVGGLRVEHYNVEINGAGAGALGLTDFEDSETTLGGKIGLIYKPVQNGTLYAAYGVSALPPGSYLSNPDISRTGGNAYPGFVEGADPVEIYNYEVGVKWDFLGGKLSTTAAAFHTEKKNIAYGGSVGFPGIAYGEQVVQGIELGIAGNLTDRWKVFGGLTVLDHERQHGADVDAAAIAANSPSDYGNAATADPKWSAANPTGVTTTDGDELAFTPNFSLALWMTYDVTDKFTLGGGVQYVGEAWLGRPDDALRLIPEGKYGKLPDYFLVNFMASYDLTDNVALQFNIDNVFDEEYAVSTNWQGTRAQLGAPRTYRIGTSFDF
ncbi:TonB-dependent receptor [Hyphomicrobium sp.]|uniref:TonB-dependent receptor n=1 Tax=Hyphomicrobium sp. TaxID=82 RepID=UPI0025C51F4E|nr:TonB-dependent receptor [Hyphomicrobium sp.]MCC7252711.1 TonB-dependent receptor [Hyphomicrobium sp.]